MEKNHKFTFLALLNKRLFNHQKKSPSEFDAKSSVLDMFVNAA